MSRRSRARLEVVTWYQLAAISTNGRKKASGAPPPHLRTKHERRGAKVLLLSKLARHSLDRRTNEPKERKH